MSYKYRLEEPDPDEAARIEQKKKERQELEDKERREDKENPKAPPMQQTGLPGSDAPTLA